MLELFWNFIFKKENCLPPGRYREKGYINTRTVNHVVQSGNMCCSLALVKGLETDIKLTNAGKGLEMKINCIKGEVIECFRDIIQTESCIPSGSGKRMDMAG